MPNWCSNDLDVRGPAEVVEKFKETVHNPETDEVFSLEAALPPASMGRGVTSPELFREEQLDAERKLLVYRMDSAWSPPEEDIEALAEMFPDLTMVLTYAESGNASFGLSYYDAGQFRAEVGFESEPWLLGVIDANLLETAKEALDRFDNGWHCPTLVSTCRPPEAATLLSGDLWEEGTLDLDDEAGTVLWWATIAPHRYMLSKLKDDPSYFEEIFHEGGERAYTDLAGFSGFLGGTVPEGLTEEQLANVCQYLLADRFDDPVDETTAQDIAQMTATTTAAELITFLQVADRQEEGTRASFVEAFCAATRPVI